MGRGGVVALERVNRLLEREIPLARDGRLYLLLDLPENRLELKAQGIVLRRFRILSSNGVPLPRLASGPHLLTGRRALRQPARPERQAGLPSEAESGGQGEGLSVRDMPAAYTLLLGTEVTLYVLGEPPASLSERALGLVADLLYRLRAAVAWVSSRLGGRPRIALRVVVPAADARLLFWSLQDGTPVLIGGVAP